MKQYTIKYTAAKSLNEIDWSAADELEISERRLVDAGTDAAKTDVRAWCKLCYNEDGIYLHFRAREREIRSEERGALAAPCNDSCMEFFFCPMEDDRHYFNIEMNPDCAIYFGYGTSIADLIRLCPEEENINEIFDTHAERTADGWTLTYRVPTALVRRFFADFTPESGKRLRANCYKCADKTSHPHWLSWNPVCNPIGKFHCRDDFGEMIME